jgi:Zn-dependent peptidase ImmA (M78 family)
MTELALSSVSRPVATAWAAREELGIGRHAPIADVLRLIEDAARIPVTLLPLPDTVAGAYGRAGADEPYIFINSRTHAVRRRFTLAHEFGHHALGHVGMIDLHEDIDRATSPRETEANQFAAEFLAPLQAVQNWMEARGYETTDLDVLVQLANDFGISAESARYRLADARFVTKPRDISNLDAQIQAGEHKTRFNLLNLELSQDGIALERVKLGSFRPSALIQRDAMEVFRYGTLSLDEIAETLGRTPDDVEHAFRERGVEPLEDELDY